MKSKMIYLYNAQVKEINQIREWGKADIGKDS